MSTALKPTANATIEPSGHRRTVPREHTIKIALRLTGTDDRHGDLGFARSLTSRSLAGFAVAAGAHDSPRVRELTMAKRPREKGGTPSVAVVGVEGTAVCHGRPADEVVEKLRSGLLGEGYLVAVKEKRECGEPECTVDAMVDWNRPSFVPSGWYSGQICGKHNYRTCTKCKSVYSMTNTNGVGQAPSVHCEVCGQVIIEWGSSKIWSAALIKRGE